MGSQHPSSSSLHNQFDHIQAHTIHYSDNQIPTQNKMSNSQNDIKFDQKMKKTSSFLELSQKLILSNKKFVDEDSFSSSNKSTVGESDSFKDLLEIDLNEEFSDIDTHDYFNQKEDNFYKQGGQTEFKWEFGGMQVWLCLMLDGCQVIREKMTISEQGQSFSKILELQKGQYQYYYIVDGERKYNPNDDSTITDDNTIVNVIDITTTPSETASGSESWMKSGNLNNTDNNNCSNYSSSSGSWSDLTESVHNEVHQPPHQQDQPRPQNARAGCIRKSTVSNHHKANRRVHFEQAPDKAVIPCCYSDFE